MSSYKSLSERKQVIADRNRARAAHFQTNASLLNKSSIPLNTLLAAAPKSLYGRPPSKRPFPTINPNPTPANSFDNGRPPPAKKPHFSPIQPAPHHFITQSNMIPSNIIPPPPQFDDVQPGCSHYPDALPPPPKHKQAPCKNKRSSCKTKRSPPTKPLKNFPIFDAPNTTPIVPPSQYRHECIETAFNCRIQTCRVYPFINQDITIFLDGIRDFIIRKIRAVLGIRRGIKVNFRLEALFSKKKDTKIFNFKTKNFLVTPGTNIISEIEEAFFSILDEIDSFTEKGSGWQFEEIIHFDICLNDCNPLKAKSYIPLPKFISDKKAVLNIKNFDQACFKYCILASLYPKNKNAERVSKYRMHDTVGLPNSLKFTNISFPVQICDIHKFEKMNEISVNVIGFDKQSKTFHPLYFNNKTHYNKTVNLLFITKDNRAHYCLIKSLSYLLSSQLSKNKNGKFICNNCLNHFYTRELLTTHEEICHLHDCARIQLPLENQKILKYREYQKEYRVPFVAYADFECILQPSFEIGKVQVHTPSSFAYIIINDYGFKPITKIYRGVDAANRFIECLYKDTQKIFKKYLLNSKPIIMTDDEKTYHNQATLCEKCKIAFDYDIASASFTNKVQDHDHISGKYRGALCIKCNLLCKRPSFLPCFFHNGSRYDFHLFVRSLCLSNCPGDVYVIPSNSETYIGVSKNVEVEQKRSFKIRFLDSFRFLSSSLDALAKTLTYEQFEYTRGHFPVALHSLVMKKGIFPYDYVSSFDKYNETSLPPKDAFFSKLYNKHISDADYQHAQQVWKACNLQTLGDYSNLYLTTDVFLLCDIFESFRTKSLSIYNLDPAHFYTSPALSWTAMMKMTKVQLELLVDCDMLLFIEKGIRGGVSQVSQRYAEANNPACPPKDPSVPSMSSIADLSYLIYLDTNNLYGLSMCKFLPKDGFTWLSQEECSNLDISLLQDTDKTGYFLEVDLEYPDALHEAHNDFPLAPLNEIVDPAWQSPYLDNFSSALLPKLLTTLFNKTKYIIHSSTLKLYLSLGLILTKIHRGITFNQSPWLKPYVEKNTKCRQEATDQFGKDFFKLMVNSIYGKCLENPRLRKRIVLCHTKEKARRLIAKSSFKEAIVFSEDLVAIHLYKEKVEFMKPVYVGMTILDLSKHHMYDFHYNVMRKKYQNDLIMMYTDTDSFIYHISNHNFYSDLEDPDFNQHFDLSNYPINLLPKSISPLAAQANKMVLGKWKDECEGDILTHFIGLRSKMYSFKVHGRSDIKKIKGVKKHIVKDTITFEDYVSCLRDKRSIDRPMKNISSHLHNLGTYEMTKKALCPYDNKKYIMTGGITCLSYGHYAIKDIENINMLEDMFIRSNQENLPGNDDEHILDSENILEEMFIISHEENFNRK